MTGLAWTDGLLRDVTFQQCKLDLTNWRMVTFDPAFFVELPCYQRVLVDAGVCSDQQAEPHRCRRMSRQIIPFAACHRPGYLNRPRRDRFRNVRSTS